jgi:hypothetical protein
MVQGDLIALGDLFVQVYLLSIGCGEFISCVLLLRRSDEM